jgi:hypothetical protein
MTIPFDPMEPWSGSIIGSEPDIGVELMEHMALTSFCEDRLTATAALPIALLPIRNLENPVWQQRLEAVSDLEGPHFHAGMTAHVHLQSRTTSCRRFTVTLVTPSIDGPTLVCCSTSPVRRWRPVHTGLSTLSTTWRRRTPSLRRGWRLSPTLSSSCWSCRCRWHPSLPTLRRSMPGRASMRTRSHRCRMR